MVDCLKIIEWTREIGFLYAETHCVAIKFQLTGFHHNFTRQQDYRPANSFKKYWILYEFNS